MAYSPSCSTRINGDLRSFPLLFPLVVSSTTGIPFIVVPSVPPEFSYSSACLRAQSDELGSYSPVNGMVSVNTHGRRDATESRSSQVGTVSSVDRIFAWV